MVDRIVLVMAEYGVDAPLWLRGERDPYEVDDAVDRALSAELRVALREWNEVFESTEECPSAAVGAAHRTDAFELAARVQLELGDGTHVWCGAGAGIDVVAESGRAVVLTAARSGTDVEFLQDGRRDVRTAREAGAYPATAKAIVHWRALSERVGLPYGDAETRALGLRTAGRVQADVGAGMQTVFFAGAAEPYSLRDLD
ncbi:hypothetical protein BIU97_08360 [Curtobacterium sp. MCBA15_009]|uniref:hypothetical protein n=1 Tax=Curtobacterium sp. MCBA15_009 TaxID=1898737 RepID=UPI0008DE7DB5|nr:hypothetical protein [Curtobacterium sp. MCBA15_009]OII10889.1 hypothetical protein BIU97_08360 [Curtobacterium sp. MCBA15_009]